VRSGGTLRADNWRLQRNRSLVIMARRWLGLGHRVWFTALVGLVVFAAAVCRVQLPFARGALATPIVAPFGSPLPGTSLEATQRFERGKAVAQRRFTPSSGLGPEYNAVSCSGCHEKPVLGGGASRYRGVFVTSHASSTFTMPVEHHFTVGTVEKAKEEHAVARRVPSPFFGVGLLAEIAPEEIARRADPRDRNKDGISGRVNFDRGFIGRFGRKAQMASLQGFVRLALRDQMGVTTMPVKMPYLAEREGPVELPTRDADAVADPEMPTEDLTHLLAFVALLAAPPPDAPTPETQRGAGLFASIGCASCHVPALAGPRGDVPAYTDLLLHDMGPSLADGVVVGEATGEEFRTQPLWGIAAAGPFMHDGRADTLDDAIRAHDGEGAAAQRRYADLAAPERASLIAFLRSHGGSDRRADGLLPNDPPAERGSLNTDDELRQKRGRALFDHDFSRAEGLGPRFNADACRSCHFDPVIGGAGPSDVDVVRYGFLGADGRFEAPRGGDTMAHRFGDVELFGRPLRDPRANVFERRQTPSILGLGLVELVPDSVLLAAADPSDRDGDGVRGVVSILPDGRIGRFGWKAQMATLSDFTEDAFKNELGVTVSRDGKDGELAPDAFGDVVFFLSHLAAPGGERKVDAAGARAFAAAGCASCHTPELPTRDAAPIALFSDLLLHDVAKRNAPLVGQPASRGFRTPPLWGIGSTAPYWHDGSAETIHEAIAHHEGEAENSRQRYLALDSAARAELEAYVLSR
jgi:CxxC motif-containing protein (DUF1111 family)